MRVSEREREREEDRVLASFLPSFLLYLGPLETRLLPGPRISTTH